MSVKATASSVLALFLVASSASAADMSGRYGLPPQLDSMASEMAYYRGIAIACRPTDGTNLNQFYWAPRLAIIPQSQKTLFSNTVKARSQPIVDQMSGPDRALRCDDALDGVESGYPSIFEAGLGAEPICWSDVTDMNRCTGTGTDDILAGVDALLDGY